MASASSVSYNDSYTHPTQGMGSQGGMSNMGGGGQQDENISGPQSSAQSVVSFIAGQFGRKHEDLKTMLDSSNNSQKLDAMKRIIGMMASGKDVSELFAAVVKNVVCKNIEVKKLVYVYLVRYAEEQQDLALLSIATFQRGLKDPNQLIRASALRVLSSIRVAVIVPIMMLSLKEAVTDMSPYVRKTAANAIPKLYSMDPEQKEHLVEIIVKLLQDKTTLVAGSTVIAFEEVCPERIDLIHKNFRKLCTMLIDIDEWGQVAVINMLLRYSRTQFLNPNKHQLAEINGKFYPSSEESEKSEDEDDGEEKKPSYSMDSDHRLLIQSCQPLLQSRNSAVIMAVAKLYHHLAPATEVGVVVKALIRLLKSHREVQTVVLSNVVTLSLQHKGLFDSYMNSFFVHTEDPTHVKRLKLEIMTNLANESSIPAILREFQTYISSSDKEFAACTIQSIGRCASNIPEVADTCLAGLIRMLSNRDENVVSESIIVIKKLLQMRNKDHSDVITHMAKLLDKVHVAMARASIIWLIGEYADKIPKIAPDVLRKMAKSFATEEGIVKLQVINLGAKLYITNSKQTRSLCQYVLQLAKYDQNYDIRDRARFIKFILFPANKTEGSNNLKKKAKKIFLVEKPAPVLQSLFKDRSQFQLGSLSHMIDAKASGYEELPDFPEQQPDPTVRNVELQPVYGNQLLLSKEKADDKQTKKSKGFYSSSEEESESESGSEDDKEEESGEEESGDESGEESEEGSEEKSESGEESEFEELSEQEEEEEEDQNEVAATKTTKQDEEDEEEEEEESSEESSDEDDESSEEETDDEEEEAEKPPPKAKSKSARPNQQSYDQLLDLDDFTSTGGTTIETNVVTPSLASDMQSLSLDPLAYSHSQLTLSPRDLPSYELLSKINGKGLTADYRFTRSPSVFSRSMVAVEISLSNKTKQDVKRIRVENKKLSPGVTMQEFNEIDCIASEGSLSVAIGINFKDTLQPVAFDLCTEVDKFSVRINIPVGELMRGTSLNQNEFTTARKKLTGMTESKLPCDLASASSGGKKIADQVMATAALNQSPSPADDLNTHRFCGQLISSGLPVLVSIVEKEEESCVIVNCEKISVASLLAKQLKTNLQK